MTLREEIINLSEDELNENAGLNLALAASTLAVSSATLVGLTNLFYKLGDKAVSFVVKKKAEKALQNLEISEKDKEEIRKIANSSWYSGVNKKVEIAKILKKYKKD